MIALTAVTLLFAFLLLWKGVYILIAGEKLKQVSLDMLYDRKKGVILWIIAVAWTLVEVLKLGPADFGSFKMPLLVFFAIIGTGAIWMLKDYLIVRAAMVVWLYIAWWVLRAAYMQEPWTRLFLVTLVYVGIIKALWFTVAPWRVRQYINWAYEKPTHYKGLASMYIVYGAVLAITGATYHLV